MIKFNIKAILFNAFYIAGCGKFKKAMKIGACWCFPSLLILMGYLYSTPQDLNYLRIFVMAFLTTYVATSIYCNHYVNSKLDLSKKFNWWLCLASLIVIPLFSIYFVLLFIVALGSNENESQLDEGGYKVKLEDGNAVLYNNGIRQHIITSNVISADNDDELIAVINGSGVGKIYKNGINVANFGNGLILATLKVENGVITAFDNYQNEYKFNENGLRI